MHLFSFERDPICPICNDREVLEHHHFLEKVKDRSRSVSGLMQKLAITHDDAYKIIDELLVTLGVCISCHKKLDSTKLPNLGYSDDEMFAMVKTQWTTYGNGLIWSKMERRKNGDNIYYDHGKGYDY